MTGKRIDELATAASLQFGDTMVVFNAGKTRQVPLLTLLRSFLGTIASGTYRNPKLEVSTDGAVTSVTNGALIASNTLDFPEIAAGATEVLTVSVTGASPGLPVTLGLPETFPSGLVATALVTATNTVTVRVYNSTGAPVNPAAGTFRCIVHTFV